MSEALYDSEAALQYEAPPELPVDILAVGYGEAEAAPSLVPTVEVTWAYRGRPGTFTSVMSKVGNWYGGMDALLRLRVWDVERVYAALGGWPAPTPLPTDYTPPPGVVFVPDLAPGAILPPGVIGQG